MSACLCGSAALADSPTFVTTSAGGLTNSAEAWFPALPAYQLRCVGAIGSSDTNAGVFSFRWGTGAYVTTLSNTASVTITLSTTNGVTNNALVFIQRANGQMISATVTNFSGTTNILVNPGAGLTVTTIPGDEVFVASSPAVTLGIGIKTNQNYQGEAIAIAPRGRPMRVVVNGNSWATVDSLSARYE